MTTKPIIALTLFLAIRVFAASNDPFTHQEPPPIVGRWDITVHDGDREYPSWLEIRQSGYRSLVGSYVGRVGSARPISEVSYDQGRFRFTLPPQWEHTTNNIPLQGQLDGEQLRGNTTDENGKPLQWVAHRAPSLDRNQPPKWGKAVTLFNGRDLSGWKPRKPTEKNGWSVKNGLLANVEPGNDLLTEGRFTDFKLHAEFRYPKGSNSGIYLRGRYEVQIEDNFGGKPDSGTIGSVYGFLTPSVNACKKPDEWQTVEITLLGRTVSVVMNGERIIDRQEIPGITGGALDSNEDKPGPILLQGDHGQVEFRNLVLTPAE